MTQAMKRVCEIDWERLAARIDEIPDEIHEILRLFDGKRTLLEVVRRSGFAEKEARAVVEKLEREGILVAARPSRAAVSDAALRAWLAESPRGRRPLLWKIAAGASIAAVALVVAIVRVSVPSASASASVATAPAPVAAAPAQVAAAPAPVAAAPAPVAAAPAPVAAAPAPVAAAPQPVAAAPAPVAAAPVPVAAAPAPIAAAPSTDGAQQATELIALARKQLDRGATKKALANAVKAADLDPNQAEAFLIIGVAQQENERTADARAAYQRYLALAPKGAHASEIRSVLRTLR